MVLSNTKKTASISTITNQNQGGGNKKSGLPKHLRDSWTSIALPSRTHQLRNRNDYAFVLYYKYF